MTVQHRFEFPVLPPRINDCRMAAKIGKHVRIIDTPQYRDWKPGSQMFIRSTRLRLPENTYFRSSILIPGRSKADVDAYTKQAIDCLCEAGATPDDKFHVDCRARWHDGENLVVIVRTEPPEPWLTIRRAGKTIRNRILQQRLF